LEAAVAALASHGRSEYPRIEFHMKMAFCDLLPWDKFLDWTAQGAVDFDGRLYLSKDLFYFIDA
jgi:hypothetical protein